jgi:hypothetical protein
MKGLAANIGTITLTLVGIVSLSAGIWDGVIEEAAKVPKPMSRILMGGWNGFVEQGAAIEGIACDENGENCRLQRGE